MWRGLLLFVVSCGTEPVFVTRHGLSVYEANGFSQATIEYTTDTLLEVSKRSGKRLEGVAVYLLDDISSCVGCGEGGGYKASTQEMWVKIFEPKCLPVSSFIHELCHVMFRGEHTHPSTWIWGEGGLVNTAVHQSAHEQCKFNASGTE